MSEQGVGDLFENPLPAAVEVENPGAGSPSWAIRKVSDEVSPATTRSDTTTEGVRGFLRAVVDDCSATLTAKVLSAKANESMVMGEGKMIMSARLISAGPRPGYTPILNDSSCPKGLPMLEASRIC